MMGNRSINMLHEKRPVFAAEKTKNMKIISQRGESFNSVQRLQRALGNRKVAELVKTKKTSKAIANGNFFKLSNFVQRLANPNCNSASKRPFADGCENFLHTCYSHAFSAAGGTALAISVEVNYRDIDDCAFPIGREDFRVSLVQCGLYDSEVGDFGIGDIGSTLAGRVTLPGAGVFVGNDNYYLKIYSRSRCRLAATASVTW